MDDTRQLECNGYIYQYDDIIKACDGENFTMSITCDDEARVATKMVNIGIDSRLQACYVPDRGDSFSNGERSITATEDTSRWKIGDKLVLATTLDCELSPESLPVFLRRLCEDTEWIEGDEECDDVVGNTLASDILYSLGFTEGKFVGREALGLD